ncbi:glycosyltransferase family 2 protein [uncultured Algibacter sp.]|uniref:glycosyltransferase family 2 protein n=1 Tax=uncultured Algibacter sp. TaxID=298659 RepID=UPI002626C3CD|nr:glycosyltransferase family 2 protein [uncultured Algibacter sp.]
MSIKVSVIIPCYNQAQYLDETLVSVLNQTYSNWECIIVNDGSTDHSECVAKNRCNLDSRFIYLYKDNGGLSSARNFGLKHANGDFIQFLDSDDLIKPEKFIEQIKNLQESDISISDYYSFIDGSNEEAPHRYLSPFLSETNYKKEIILDWEYRKSIPCHSVLFSRKLIIENNLSFNERLLNHEDWVFWVQLFYYSNSIKNNKNKLALYRIHNRSMSTDFKLMKKGFLQAAKILQTFFKNEGSDELYKLTKKKYKEIYHKNRAPFFKRIKSKIYSKLAFYYHYVRKN